MNGLQKWDCVINAGKIGSLQAKNIVLTVLIRFKKLTQRGMTVKKQKNISPGEGKSTDRKKKMEYASGAMKRQHTECIVTSII